MPTFRITKEICTVTEESFDIEAVDQDEAERRFSEEYSDGDQLFPIHEETINRHWEISVEELD